MKETNKKIRIIFAKYFFAFVVVFSFATTEVYAQLNALDYRLQKRPKLEKFKSNKFFDHTFVSLSAGAQFNFMEKGHKTDIGPAVRYYFGKWFTPVIGARFGLDMSVLYHYEEKTHGLFGFNLDYMANLSAFVSGYNPKRVFELYGILGVTYKRSFRYGFGTNVYGGAAGFQANFRVSPMVNLFLEPKVTLVNDTYDERIINRPFDVLPELTVGVTYNMVPTSLRKSMTLGKTSFKDHMFFSAAFGGQRVITKLMSVSGADKDGWFGPAGMIAFGGWFTPVHGLRLSVMGGTTSYQFENPKYGNKLCSVTPRLDYLVNYSSAFGGYNEKRIFELIGTYGLELGVSWPVNEKSKVSAGLGLGLQGRFRINSSIDFFMEPRMSFYTKKYTSGNLNKFDGVASMVFGLTYHSTDAEYRKNNVKFENKSKVDHAFMSFTYGVGGMLIHRDAGMTMTQSIVSQFSFALGKWLTPISGLQLSGGMIAFGTKEGAYHRARAVLIGGDYLFNMTNMLCGYNENRFFELIFGIGVSAFYHNTTFSPALQAQVQTKFNLKKNWSVFVEPEALWVVRRGIIASNGATRKSLLLTVNLGTSYSMRGYDPASYHTFKENNGRRLFVSLAPGFGGIVYNTRQDDDQKRISPSVRFSVGSWSSPIGGWRMSLMTEKLKSINSQKFIIHAGLGAEFMFNITNTAMGYNPKRIFDLNAIGGVHAGFSIVQRDIRFIPGFTGSLQGNFRINSNVSLYLEPQLAIYFNKFDGENKHKSVGMLHIGATYIINKVERKERSFTKYDIKNRNFLTLNGGFGLFGNTLFSPYGKFKDFMTYSGGVALGRWITPSHGVRLSAEYTFVSKPYEYNGMSMGIMSTRVDYMLNLTSLIKGYDPDRLFDAVIFAGVGAAFPLMKTNTSFETSATYTAAIGFQAKFNVSKHFDVLLEARGAFIGDKIDGYVSRAKFDANGGILAGFNYKF
ncbi:MAG: hypothetical protein RRY55_00035 [Bacteroidales bacterium]